MKSRIMVHPEKIKRMIKVTILAHDVREKIEIIWSIRISKVTVIRDCVPLIVLSRETAFELFSFSNIIIIKSS